MKEEVFEKFANKALTYLENTEAFLKDQIPDYFQQVVSYYAIQSWIYVALSVSLIFCSFYILRIGHANAKKKDSEFNPESFMPHFIAGAFLFILSFVAFTDFFPTALKATIAPKVFVVDYLRGKE